MNTLYKILNPAHSGWRWIVLILLVLVIIEAHKGWKGNKTFTDKNKKLALFAMIAFHIQFLAGLVLYFVSPKVAFISETMSNKLLRFFTVEHSLMMIIAMILITIGHSKSKKATLDTQKFKSIAVYYTIAFIIIMIAIPWPFRTALGGGWF
ncbi:hypothetical protein [Crocinitomix catalasitica]|uniref:hypothetical protein n=1 Tax=Crocinitomix catalasitica TaxID=184607 RepID=UPI00056BEE4A|nr:hypothetical protein [Crocinitomix catalasitica]